MSVAYPLVGFAFALAILPFCGGFSQEHTVAWFNPLVTSLKFYDGRDRYSQSQIDSMVSRQISARFRILVSPWYSNDPSTQKIPKAVAKFNKLTRTPERRPLELMIMFRWSEILDLVADSAHEANSLYPNTVSTLIYEPKVFGEVDVIGNVSILSASLATSGRQYKFGLYLKIEHCRPGEPNHYLSRVLDHLNVIFFQWFPTTADYLKGARATFETLVSLATPCREKMVALKPGLKVGFRTTWPSTGPSGVQNISDMALYWSLMNEFGERSGSFVIPSDAFDQVGVDTLGWWRLKDGSPSSTHFTVVEKAESFTDLFEPHNQMTPIVHSSTVAPEGNPVMLAGGVAGVLIITTLAIGALFVVRRTIWKSKLLIAPPPPPPEVKLCLVGDINLKLGNVILGSGEFGVVRPGQFETQPGHWLDVAVKTTKPGCTALNELQILGEEIKILTLVGKHDNIVHLIGSQITHQGVYVVLEYCAHGTLEAHLRRGTGNYENMIKTRDLKQWACEIACGMEFLASKNVVHGDLATRNILLEGDNKTAKICDFGLSRHLDHHNGVYEVKKKSAIPWKWMSPEALRKVLSEKSDVWSFGVVLWELYSLGDRPYRGRSWTTDWISLLESGRVKLKQPKWSDSVMYAIMCTCWERDPERRPPFAVLKPMVSHLGRSGGSSSPPA